MVTISHVYFQLTRREARLPKNSLGRCALFLPLRIQSIRDWRRFGLQSVHRTVSSNQYGNNHRRSKVRACTYPRSVQIYGQGLCTFPVIDSVLVGTVVAIYTIGCLIGALASSYVANPLGRRSAIVMFAMIAAVGAVLQGSSFGIGQIVTGRIISGLGVGGVNSVVPVWQAESSKPKNRGKNVVVMGTFIASGIAMASWVNFGLSYRQQTSLCWRLPLTIPIVFCLAICITTFMFPESPRWLVQKGRIEEAKAVISSLEDVPIDSEHIAIEVDFIRQSCNNGAVRERGYFDLFKTGRERLLYRTSLSILINFCAQMTGTRCKAFPTKAMTDL